MKRVLTALLLLIPGGIIAQDVKSVKDIEAVKAEFYSQYFLGQALLTEATGPEIVIQTDAAGKKSAAKAAILSLVIPGAGQFYAGNKIRAAAFLFADIALLYGRRQYRNDGDEITNEFRAYADQYWSREDYGAWYSQQPDDVKAAFAHHLPDTNTQQYYEMIGKYHQFLAGWPDSEGQPQDSDMRHLYMGRQDESNKKYKRADLLTQLMVLNRVISAFEAALFVHRSNSMFRPGLSFVPASESSIAPVAHLTIIW